MSNEKELEDAVAEAAKQFTPAIIDFVGTLVDGKQAVEMYVVVPPVVQLRVLMPRERCVAMVRGLLTELPEASLVV